MASGGTALIGTTAVPSVIRVVAAAICASWPRPSSSGGWLTHSDR
jgi:hypothetical protein